MKRSSSGIVAVLAGGMLAFATGANAEILAAGAIFGGSSQDNAVCYVFNAGAGKVSITTNQIIRQDGVVLTLTSDTCSALDAGKICFIHGVVANNAGYACKIVVTPSGDDVRGALELRSGLNVLKNIELR